MVKHEVWGLIAQMKMFMHYQNIVYDNDVHIYVLQDQVISWELLTQQKLKEMNDLEETS